MCLVLILLDAAYGLQDWLLRTPSSLAPDRYLLSRSGRQSAGMRQSGMTLIKGRGLCGQLSDGFLGPSVWGKVELSLGLHRALIPAARFCVIREDRLNSPWLQSQGSGRIRNYRFPYCVDRSLCGSSWTALAAPGLGCRISQIRTTANDRHPDINQCSLTGDFN